MNIKKISLGISGAFAGIFLLAGSVLASSTLFGEASFVSPGSSSNSAVELVSDADPGFGGVSFSVPSEVSTFVDLSVLSADVNVTDDDCAGGGPRFQVRVDTGSGLKNIFVYIGPEPNYTGCTPNTWVNSGDLLDAARKIDTSQLGGTFYDTYANALTNYGSYPVVSISLVTDSGWAFGDGEQTVRVDNVLVNSDLYTFEPPSTKDECKKDGWKAFSNPVFKNQGDCVSFVASGK